MWLKLVLLCKFSTHMRLFKGAVAKLILSPFVTHRVRSWLKIPCGLLYVSNSMLL